MEVSGFTDIALAAASAEKNLREKYNVRFVWPWGMLILAIGIVKRVNFYLIPLPFVSLIGGANLIVAGNDYCYIHPHGPRGPRFV